MKFIFTTHAKDRLRQRGIKLTSVKDAFKNPSLRKPSYYPKEIINFIDKQGTLEIVFEQKNDIVIIVTAYYL